jgi:cell wall-associated NlpC family hydrolase
MPDPASAAKVALAAAATPLLAISTVLLLLGGAGASASAASAECGGAGTGQMVAGVNLDAEQMGNAQTIVSVAAGRQLPVLAAVIAVDTAYTESTLHNSTSQTDHDSEGLFQQRVSIYGAQIAADPVNATNAFLDKLIQLSSWQTTPIGVDAQTVQQSAHPERYQPNAGLAQQVVGQLWPTASAAANAPVDTTASESSSTTTGSRTMQSFFSDVLQALQLPASPPNLDVLYAVAQLEGPNDRYNPLNSVVPEPGSTPFNSAGVQRYLSFASGVQGTVDLLRGAHWDGVRAALAADHGTTAVLGAFTAAYTWDPGVTFPTTNLAAVAARSVGPVPGNATGPAICAGGGGATTGGTVAGTIVGPTGNNIAGSTTIPSGFTLSGSAQGIAAVQFALQQLGKPYVFAAAGPDAFDCSGLTMAAWAAAGVALPHLAAGQTSDGTAEPTNLSQAVSGDLVMIPGSAGTAQAPGHVGLVAGYVDAADGRHLYLIQAPETGVPVELTQATEWSGQIVDVRHIA